MRQHHLLPTLCNLLSCQSGTHSPTSRCSSAPRSAAMARAEFRATHCPRLHTDHASRAGVAPCLSQCPLILPAGICFLLEDTLQPAPAGGTGTSPTVLPGCQPTLAVALAVGRMLAPMPRWAGAGLSPMVLTYFLGSVSSGTCVRLISLWESVPATEHAYPVPRAGGLYPPHFSWRLSCTWQTQRCPGLGAWATTAACVELESPSRHHVARS